MAKIVFEPTGSFDILDSDLQKTAREYLIGREFDSVREAFNQRNEKGSRIGSNFYIPKQTVVIEDLPQVINEADVYACWSDFRSNYSLLVLKARAKEEERRFERDIFG